MDYIYSNSSLPNIVDTIRYRIHSPKGEFPVSGVTAFCGVQGSGKTLSAVLYVHKLMSLYPDSICVSNISLNFYNDRVLPYTGVDQMHSINNGSRGVIFLLDEIQIEFNSLESKAMNIPIFELVCQQRKQRKHIVGTTQVFGRLAKPFREQFREVILCDNFFGLLFRQRIYSASNVAYDDDIKTELSPRGTKFYFVKPSDFGLYDSYAVINRIRK